MKRLLSAVVLVGALAVAGAAQAHGGHHRDDCYRGPSVRYYAPPVVYARPVVYPTQAYYAPYASPQTCGSPVVYDSYYTPWNNVSFYGRNFGVQLGW